MSSQGCPSLATGPGTQASSLDPSALVPAGGEDNHWDQEETELVISKIINLSYHLFWL